jgi:hypothetical protein
VGGWRSAARDVAPTGPARAQIVGQGKAILGYTVVGHVALLLLAEKVRVSATLPGNHDVKTAITTRWHRIALQVGPAHCPRAARRPSSCTAAAVLLRCCMRRLRRCRRRPRAPPAWPAQQPDTDPTGVRGVKEEVERGIDKIVTLPLDGEQAGACRWRGAGGWGLGAGGWGLGAGG